MNSRKLTRSVASFSFLIVLGAIITGCTGGMAVGNTDSSSSIPRLIAAVPLPTYVPLAAPTVAASSVIAKIPQPVPTLLTSATLIIGVSR